MGKKEKGVEVRGKEASDDHGGMTRPLPQLSSSAKHHRMDGR
jgi:hypothetical protein